MTTNDSSAEPEKNCSSHQHHDHDSHDLRHNTELSCALGANVAAKLSLWARRLPGAIAIAEPNGPVNADGNRSYAVTTFKELDDQSDAIARGLLRWGIKPGMRIVMLVPFSAMFIRLAFALLKAGVVVVLVDPGMGRKNLIDAIAGAEPDGFVGIPKAQAIVRLMRHRFKRAKWNVTVGRRYFWGGKTLGQIISMGIPRSASNRLAGKVSTTVPSEQTTENDLLPLVTAETDAAVIFTTGSTGPPKGVAYTHGTFNSQVERIQERYDIKPGSRDLACFPLFGLFDNVMGVTTIIPDMDPTRPAEVNPRRIHEAITQWEIDQAFGSPALWHRVVSWCEETGIKFPSLRRVLSAGAPVPATTLARLRAVIHPDADVVTPYGATEALPIASIESRQVIMRTGPAAAKGRGVCVGSRFREVEWRVIAIDDGAIATIDQTVTMPTGKIGELMVAGPMVTRRYVVRADQNALHKVIDGPTVWHRMGDVGYLDTEDQFWFCGRKSHRIVNGNKTWFTIPCEAIFNSHPQVYRTALIGFGPKGNQTPVIIVEPEGNCRPMSTEARAKLISELRELAVRNPLTQRIEDIRIHPGTLPVDIRHNSKIFRERLAADLQKTPDRWLE